MKNEKNKTLDFFKHAIIELNHNNLLKINGGALVPQSTEPNCLKIRPTTIFTKETFTL